MKIKNISSFKDPNHDKTWFEHWTQKLEQLNGKHYKHIPLETSLGKTQVYGLNTDATDTTALVIFPGARTTSLIWDLDNGLNNLGINLRIFLIETNGLPNLSDGSTPDIHSLGYGEWAKEVLDKLGIEAAFIAGASFGGLVCMKLALVAPDSVRAAFLLNPGCLQTFSFAPKNMYYNLLPILSPSEKNVRTFLDKAVFCKPHHHLSKEAEQMLVDYEVFACKRYNDKTQKPYYMGNELAHVTVETYLLEGDKDLLFPFQTSIDNAKKHLKNLKDVRVFENVGHGIETYDKALNYIGKIIGEL